MVTGSTGVRVGPSYGEAGVVDQPGVVDHLVAEHRFSLPPAGAGGREHIDGVVEFLR